MNQAEALTQLKQEILDNKVCPDLAASATQLVLGDGNPDADIAFIGEAPGAEEDKQGKPFVGRAGQFLNDMLQLIHLQREDVYITNIVKYRPPNNRDPEDEEKAAFLPYLHKQLAIIQPKLIVTLGRHSMNAFLPDFRISEVHGRAFRKKSMTGQFDVGTMKQRGAEQTVLEAQNASTAADDAVTAQEPKQSDELSSSAGFGGRPVILPLYHPAAALYNGAMRDTLIEDFKKIPKILAKI